MIKVFKIKDINNFCVKILVPLIIIFIAMNLINNNKSNASSNGTAFLSCIEDSIPNIKASKVNTNDNNNKEITIEDFQNEIQNTIDYKMKELPKYILSSEFSILNNSNDKTENTTEDKDNKLNNNIIEFADMKDNNKNNVSSIETNVNNKIKQADINVKTEVVPNNVDPRTTDEYQGVKINNSTEYELSDEILNPDGIEINKNKILIFHTHTCESYTPTEKYNYEQSGNFRSNDLSYSVARVGDELEQQLKSYGYNVIHDKTYHDYPAYNGSYSRSLETVQNILKDNSDIDIIIDLHRDAIADSTYAPKVKIGDEYASQLMFVMGTDSAEGIHKDWQQNLKFAVKVQKKANELYNGLFKPIILRNSDYNEFTSRAACIIEVGATGNTLEESMNSMKYLAKVIDQI